ncbi:hypothetical protein AG4045_008583 [Apium graveolens]|uniref:Uncharacterized protein n=1 Tax=Apium graveolens TaxID=4045 RepID=A0A6L5BD06_APIGR|nr:hypothetical protein AG4045_008583 [Apium graveolens]
MVVFPKIGAALSETGRVHQFHYHISFNESALYLGILYFDGFQSDLLGNMIYWTSGKLINQNFEYIRPMVEFINLNYKFKIISNEEQEYFYYTLMVDPVFTPESRKLLSGWHLDYQGNIFDEDRPQIAGVDNCYGYNTRSSPPHTFYAGCKLWEQPMCRDPLQYEIQTVVTNQKNTLKQGEFFDSSTTLVSSNSLFSMGFFHIKDSDLS